VRRCAETHDGDEQWSGCGGRGRRLRRRWGLPWSSDHESRRPGQPHRSQSNDSAHTIP
jgi:hypothetical protein